MYQVVVNQWTPDDYIEHYRIECRFKWSAALVAKWFNLTGWSHVDIEHKEA